MPVDSQQIMYYKGQSNKDRIVTPNGEVIACEMEGDASQAIGIGYIPHWGDLRWMHFLRPENKKENYGRNSFLKHGRIKQWQR